jgi:1,2-diacylglycerol 3-beta-galactosyltransferase
LRLLRTPPPTHTHTTNAQEEGNIPYIIDNDVGDFETDPSKIAHILHRWLLGNKQDQAHFSHMAAR